MLVLGVRVVEGWCGAAAVGRAATRAELEEALWQEASHPHP